MYGVYIYLLIIIIWNKLFIVEIRRIICFLIVYIYIVVCKFFCLCIWIGIINKWFKKLNVDYVYLLDNIMLYIYIYKYDMVIKNNKFYFWKMILNKNFLFDILDIFKIKVIFFFECMFVFDEGNESRK